MRALLFLLLSVALGGVSAVVDGVASGAASAGAASAGAASAGAVSAVVIADTAFAALDSNVNVDVDVDDAGDGERGCRGCNDEDDCPPTCPTCVYTQGIRVVPPSSPTVQPLVDVGVHVVLKHWPRPVVNITAPPTAPALEGVFHPPRIARVCA